MQLVHKGGYCLDYRVRREKAMVHSVSKPARELVRSTFSNQSSSGGNETAEASGEETRVA